MKVTCENCKEHFIITNIIKYHPNCPHCGAKLNLGKCVNQAYVAELRSLVSSGIVGDLDGKLITSKGFKR